MSKKDLLVMCHKPLCDYDMILGIPVNTSVVIKKVNCAFLLIRTFRQACSQDFTLEAQKLSG